jgi:hypothetical protein
MTDRELLLDACYAYEALAGLGGLTDRHKEAYKKLRAKLSEPEPEPIAFLSQTRKNYVVVGQHQWNVGIEDWIPLYTAPPQRKECLRCGEVNPADIHTCTPQREWQGLTDEEIEQIVDQYWEDFSMFAEAIEAKLKEKNA